MELSSLSDSTFKSFMFTACNGHDGGFRPPKFANTRNQGSLPTPSHPRKELVVKHLPAHDCPGPTCQALYPEAAVKGLLGIFVHVYM